MTTLGSVPSGLPHFGLPTLPPMTAWWTLIATAASLFLVILAQSAATSRAYAVKYDEMDFEEDVDLVGLGLSNVAAGLSGTFVVNGSPTKTQMVDGAGGRSQLAQLTTAAITLCVLLWLTKPLSFMPNAVLSSVVFLIGVELVDVKGMTRVFRLRQVEFWVALITAATVVVVGVEQGILLAIALSLIVHVRHSYRPTDLVVTYTDGEGRTHPLTSGAQAAPGLVVYHFGADLYYANSEAFQTEMLGLVGSADPRVEWLVLDGSAMGDIDYTGVSTIDKLIPTLASKRVTLVAINLSPPTSSRTGQVGTHRAAFRQECLPWAEGSPRGVREARQPDQAGTEGSARQ